MISFQTNQWLVQTQRKVVRRLLFLAISCISLLVCPATAQDTTETYLRPYKDTLKLTLHDTTRIVRLRKIGDYYRYIAKAKQQHLDSAYHYLLMAAVLAEEKTYPYYIAQTSLSIAWYFNAINQYEALRVHFNKAIREWQAIDAQQEIDLAWIWAAFNVSRTEKNADLIIEAAQHTYHYFKEKKDTVRIINSLGAIAEMHFRKGELDLAETEMEAVIEKCKEANYSYIHLYYNKLSFITRYKGNYAKTMRMSQLAVETLLLPRDSAYAKTYYRDLAELYFNTGQPDKYEEYVIKSLSYGTGSAFRKAKALLALEYFRSGDKATFIRELLELLKTTKPADEYEWQSLNIDLAYTYAEVQEFEKSEAYYMKVHEFRKKNSAPDNEETLYTSYYIASMYIAWKKFEKARPYLDEMLAIPEGHFPLGLKREAHYMYYQIDSANGRYLSAINHLLEYKKLFDKITSETSSWQFQELTTRFETNQKEAQLKQMTDSNLLQQTRLRMLNDSIMADTRQRQLEELKREIAEAERNKDIKLLHAENLLAQARLIALSDSISNTDKLSRLAAVQDSLLVAQKEQNIKLLTSESALQQKKLSTAQLQRDFILSAIAVMALIIGVLIYFYRSKQKANQKIQQQNAALQRLVEEKEWLLKEVHHRVKNNLHTVVSLLESQSAYLTDDALAAVINSQNRVYAMSLIHQKLYKSGDMSTVDMATYLPELMEYLAESYDPGKKIRFEYHIASVHLDGSCAVPVGLIVNEAVTNSMKYAFSGTINPTLKLSLTEPQAGWMLLTISDNGIGISDLQIMENTGSLGLKLIRGLAQDIGGHAEIFNNEGTRVVVRIPANHIPGFSFPHSQDLISSN